MASQDPLLKAIADGANIAVMSVGYRLAPEHPFPKGPQDCFDAAEWLVDHGQAHFGVPLKFLGGEVCPLTEKVRSLSILLTSASLLEAT